MMNYIKLLSALFLSFFCTSLVQAQLSSERLASEYSLDKGANRNNKQGKVSNKDIKPSKKIIPFIEFKQAKISDAVILLSDIADINIAATEQAAQSLVSFRMKGASVKAVIDTMARVSGLWARYMRSTDSYLLMTTEQYQNDIVVFRDDIVRTFELRHQNVEAAAKTIRNLFGERVVLTLEHKNDDFIGLPFEDISDATTTGGSGNGSGGSARGGQGRSGGGQFGQGGFGQQGGQGRLGGQNAKQQVTKGEDGTVAGEQLSTLDSFVQDVNKQQQLLSTGQLANLQGNRISDQKIAKITDAQTPIYITINRIHNLLFVRTTDDEALVEIEKLIKVSDKPTPQVLLEMEIIEIDISDQYDKEFDLSLNTAGKIDDLALQSPNEDNPYISADNATIENFANIGLNLEEPTAANYILQAAALLRGENIQALTTGGAGGVYNFISNKVNASVELLKRNGQARTLSKPVVLASNNRQAKIFIGDEQIIATGIENLGRFVEYDAEGRPISSNDNETTLETERRKVGNTLYLMPSINADRTITLDVLQDQSKVVRNGTQIPFYDSENNAIKHQAIDAVNQSNIKTTVVAKDGLTIALGGMVSSTSSLEKSKVPVLGDIPLLGALFRQEHEVNRSYQYIMLVTPHIIMSPDENVAKAKKVSGFDYNKHADHQAESDFPDYGFDRYIALTQFAAQAAKQNNWVKSNGSIKAVELDGGSVAAILPTHGISARLKGIWQQGNLYVSAFRIKNHTPMSQVLEANSLQGNWLSATFAQQRLNAYSQEGDSSYLYLVSDKPYQQILQQLKEQKQQR